MVTLKGEHIYLRALEPEDVDFLYVIENDESIWQVSNTQTPYSRFLIRQYLENAHQDIHEARQLRLAICENGVFEAAGLIDLFEFDPVNSRAGVGIVIHEKDNRGKGYGGEALNLVIQYATHHLRLHQLYANIDPANAASISLFTNFGFALAGVKQQWNRHADGYKDEALYQRISHI